MTTTHKPTVKPVGMVVFCFLLSLLLLVVLLTDHGMEALHPRSVNRERCRKSNIVAQHTLIPSQVIRPHHVLYPARLTTVSSYTRESVDIGGTDVSVSPDTAPQVLSVPAIEFSDGALKRRRRRKRPKTKANSVVARVAPPMEIEPLVRDGNQTTSSFPLTGNQPDIFWRSVSMSHLRQHPRFRPLPEPGRISHLESMEDVRFFRQDSWQWDTLHHGRCTTSQAVAALGFLEPVAGEILGVPTAWRRGGTGAFVRLRETALRSLDDVNKVLFASETKSPTTTTVAANVENTESAAVVWHEAVSDEGGTLHFAARYDYRLSDGEGKERKSFAQRFFQNENLCKSIRMMWGNTQEATAMLTALNYFSKSDPDFTLEEVGMCGAGLDLNTKMQCSSLLVGATPDGVLRFSNGRLEALEVKNHCPFYSNSFGRVKSKNKGGKRKRFSVGSQSFERDKTNGVFSHYIPQLQLEMFCLGPECKSAVMVRQTATSGALVLRMHRDDDWIEEMIYWLHRFHLDFVDKDKPPPKNFFWNATDSEERSRYRRFVNKTKEIRTSHVDIVGHVLNDEVQRMSGEASLFLD